jgi:hypothetical protein
MITAIGILAINTWSLYCFASSGFFLMSALGEAVPDFSLRLGASFAALPSLPPGCAEALD